LPCRDINGIEALRAFGAINSAQPPLSGQEEDEGVVQHVAAE
jgi:hypothetical protein